MEDHSLSTQLAWVMHLVVHSFSGQRNALACCHFRPPDYTSHPREHKAKLCKDLTTSRCRQPRHWILVEGPTRSQDCRLNAEIELQGFRQHGPCSWIRTARSVFYPRQAKNNYTTTTIITNSKPLRYRQKLQPPLLTTIQVCYFFLRSVRTIKKGIATSNY